MQEMMRVPRLALAGLAGFLAVAALIGLWATPAAGQRGPGPMESALAAARAGSWDNAAAIAGRAGPAGPVLIEWQRLRAGAGDLAAALAFQEAHPDWPGLSLLRRRSEAEAETAPARDVLRFFDLAPPQTVTGALAYAQALVADGRADMASAMLAAFWRSEPLSEADEARLLAGFGAALAPHHPARLEMLLWRGDGAAAERLLPRVSADLAALARARIALRAGRDGVNALIDAVPAALADVPGLAHDRFLWRQRAGRSDSAVELLLERSDSAARLGRPEAWAGQRRNLTRIRMRAGQAAEAYMIASSHQLHEGAAYADLEWLAGYVALSYLNDPALALDHFQRLRMAVSGPISLGRAGYWIGRAQEALGDAEAAQLAYAQAAEHQTSFYGLLAAERAGIGFDPALAAPVPAGLARWQEAEFTGRTLFQAGVLALNAGDLALARQLLVHLAAGLDDTAVAQLGQMALDLQEPHLAVMIGKEAAGRGLVLPGPYYALHPLKDLGLPTAPEMALAIARRESEFNPAVVSGAGALGLMQLMPATAAEMAGKLGLEHDPGRVLSDPVYNARLGGAYLAELAARFDGNVVLVSAAYNAGPSRPLRWMSEMGDPRQTGVDMIDWIEHLPFAETRNYVMRVTESLPIYRARLGLDPHPVPFSQELTGRSLLR